MVIVMLIQLIIFYAFQLIALFLVVTNVLVALVEYYSFYVVIDIDYDDANYDVIDDADDFMLCMKICINNCKYKYKYYNYTYVNRNYNYIYINAI